MASQKYNHDGRPMRKPHCYGRLYMTKIRPMTGEVFFTLYTSLLDQKRRHLIRIAIRRRLRRQVAQMLKDAPPDVKGALLLAEWDAKNK